MKCNKKFIIVWKCQIKLLNYYLLFDSESEYLFREILVKSCLVYWEIATNKKIEFILDL